MKWRGRTYFDPGAMIWTNTVIIIQICKNEELGQKVRTKVGFSLIWSSDLDFELVWSLFELGLKMVKANILTEFQEDLAKIDAAIVLIMFFFDLTW